MKTNGASVLPPKQHAAAVRAVRLEWITIGYLISAIIVVYFTMGNSQAMKTAWAEDFLSLIPPIVYLVSERFRKKAPTDQFPYGFHRITSIAFLLAAAALLTMGLLLMYDSASKLIRAEHPSIGSMSVFGVTMWAGWPMIAGAIYSAMPAAFLGLKKVPLGKILHNKVLNADAHMNKADWLTGVAAVLGILGIALGWWWADSVAALIISMDIAHDGLKHTKEVFQDLMDRVPRTVVEDTEEPVLKRIKEYLAAQPWVKDHCVMMREEGLFFFGEAFVVPQGEDHLMERIEQAVADIRGMDWRLRFFVLMPVRVLP
ncbi:MAG: cation diffusion facilitator family transporter [Bdellovibrionales bacterium]